MSRGGKVGVGRTVPGEYGVGVRAEGLWRGQGVCRGWGELGVRRQVSSESVCSFGIELGRTEQAMCDHVRCMWGWEGPGGGEEWAQVSRDGPSMEYGLDLKASAR